MDDDLERDREREKYFSIPLSPFDPRYSRFFVFARLEPEAKAYVRRIRRFGGLDRREERGFATVISRFTLYALRSCDMAAFLLVTRVRRARPHWNFKEKASSECSYFRGRQP